MAEAVRGLKREKSPAVDQLVAEAYQNLSVLQLNALIGICNEHMP